MIFLYAAAAGEVGLLPAPPPPYQDPLPSYQTTGFTVVGEERSQISRLQEELSQLRQYVEWLTEMQRQQWDCTCQLSQELGEARAEIESLKEEKVARDLEQVLSDLERVNAAA
jgi:TolA-binding protein